MRISGSRVLITGASGGIGRALAEEFAGRGAELVISGRNESALAEVAAQLPGSVEVLPADLATADGARALAERAGAIDILMSNAGIEIAHPVEELTPEQISAAVTVNFTTAVILASKLGQGMLARSRGHIALMSSMGGRFGSPGPIYTASKWGLRGLALSLRQDWAPRGVGVSVIYPGAVEGVGMIARGLPSLEHQPPRWQIRPVTAQAVARATAEAIEANRLETVVADPMLKIAARLGGLAPGPIAKVMHKLPAAKAVREAMIRGSELGQS